MERLRFKEFTWPRNPHTYQETITRGPVYTTQDGVTNYVGMSARQRVIAGSGVFCGESALGDFRDLITVAESGSPGNLVHPDWGTRYCYFTKLELTQEPRENYVSYRFEFIQANNDGTIPK